MDSSVIKNPKELIPRKTKNGRKPKYATEEERAMAHKRSASEYYQRNKDNISKKNIEYYTKIKYLQENNVEYHYNSKYYRQYVLNSNDDYSEKNTESKDMFNIKSAGIST